YWGVDLLDLSNFGEGNDGENDVLRLRWRWGNQVAGTRLLQPLGRGWIGETRIGFSRFAERLGFADFGDVRFESRIRQGVGSVEISRDLSPAASLRTGVSSD